jgi:hypothetical protein
MQAVKIRDMRPDGKCLAVDLRHVLDALGSRVVTSTWRVSDVWALGDAAGALEALGEQHAVTGAQLLQLAHGVYQVIDGAFFGSDFGSLPWVVVQAIDSSYYLVHSDDATVLDAMGHVFHAVSDAESKF